jgi:hypothetical protein
MFAIRSFLIATGQNILSAAARRRLTQSKCRRKKPRAARVG